MHYATLNSRALVRISGEDAVEFLQGLVSNDVRHVQEGRAVYAALLSPRGKYLHDFFLLPWQGAILIDCEEGHARDLLQRLQLYKLRSKVAIEFLPKTLGAVALWGEGDGLSDNALMSIFPDPRLAELGWRAVGDLTAILARSEQAGFSRADDAAYDRLRLTLGVPDGHRDLVSDKSLLMEWGFEDLHGVDFHKGCYVGQEVTARSKHRGQVRKFIYKVQAVGGLLPVAGTPIMAGEISAGELRSSSGDIGLAWIAVEHAEKPLTAGGLPLSVAVPTWATPVAA